jgi:hypothetical protein
VATCCFSALFILLHDCVYTLSFGVCTHAAARNTCRILCLVHDKVVNTSDLRMLLVLHDILHFHCSFLLSCYSSRIIYNGPPIGHVMSLLFFICFDKLWQIRNHALCVRIRHINAQCRTCCLTTEMMLRTNVDKLLKFPVTLERTLERSLEQSLERTCQCTTQPVAFVFTLHCRTSSLRYILLNMLCVIPAAGKQVSRFQT